MGHEEMRVPEDLSGAVRAAFGLAPSRAESLGRLVKGIAAEWYPCRPEYLISVTPTRHQVRVNGQALHTFCFVDSLMLPFVLPAAKFGVLSESPLGGKVAAFVTKEGVEVWPKGAVVSFGAARGTEGLIGVKRCLCPYLNAFPSRSEYERWTTRTPQAVTLALSPPDAFALARDWSSGGSGVAEAEGAAPPMAPLRTMKKGGRRAG